MSTLRQAAIRNKNKNKKTTKGRAGEGKKELWREQSWQKENEGEEGGRGVTQSRGGRVGHSGEGARGRV